MTGAALVRSGEVRAGEVLVELSAQTYPGSSGQANLVCSEQAYPSHAVAAANAAIAEMLMMYGQRAGSRFTTRTTATIVP